jgi:uncharacterized protein (TIGR02145 family)/prepilin-type N-terminal cleavage/methylation domain-containing protein
MDTRRRNKSWYSPKAGFTIVELLVVIVVIGILAAVTLVSYNGISQRAKVASIQAELTNASKKLAMYYTENSVYPDDLDTSGCPTGPKIDSNYCIKYSQNTSFDYNLLTPSTYELFFSNDTLSYEVTESLTPFNTNKIPITAIAAVSGTNQISQTLTAGAVTPSSATVSYKWQSSPTSGGTYTDISGATSSTYVVSPSYMNKYIKVMATGNGDYSGSQASTTSSAIAADASWQIVGNQAWSKTNLNFGTMITGVTNQTNNSTTEKYCYSNNAANCATYGGLYQWDEAMQYSSTEGARGICVAGAHIPSDNDWKILEIQLGMTQVQADSTGYRGTNQGTQLVNGGSSGLNILTAGDRGTDGGFYDLSTHALLWSSSVSGASIWSRHIMASGATVGHTTDNKISGLSVRCVGN